MLKYIAMHVHFSNDFDHIYYNLYQILVILVLTNIDCLVMQIPNENANLNNW